MKSPCSKDCAERSASCHCSCTAYQDYYKANAERLGERAKRVSFHLDVEDERRQSIKRWNRKNGRR